MINEFIEKPASLASIVKRGLVYGVGINDANYIAIYKDEFGKRIRCPFYVRWSSMLMRCYSEKLQEKKPTYKGCIVCDEWLIFSNFRAWMEVQEWEGMELDKDIIGGSAKKYSPELCAFIPASLNKLLGDSSASRGGCPQGVHLHRASGKFEAQCSGNSKMNYLGLFNTANEAEAVYKSFKSKLIRKTAENYMYDERIYKGLILAADRLAA